MGLFRKSGHAHLMVSAAVGALTLGSGAAWAQSKPINVAPQPLTSALNDFGIQTGQQVFFTTQLTAAKVSPGVTGATDERMALAQLLEGTGLTFRREANAFIIEQGEGGSPQGESAAGGGAEVEALIVTAQKREEDIQDVPIAISAFSQETLERSQVAGGPDLMTQVPNMTFTKTNFSSYSIQLRGIGTQAISATTDPAVAVAFNNTPFIRNHFFEQEFYDLQRVEVLRGPQGTLYGRNATAGVVNVISQKPKFIYEAKLAGDVANYNSTRIEGMVNIPLVEDTVALRLAGAWTKREGYATNEITGNAIDGRDLWSTRASLRFTPNDRLDVNLIYEHFEEDDDRIRAGKQLCKTDLRPEEIGGVLLGDSLPEDSGQGGGSDTGGILQFAGPSARLSLGCEPASLYSPDSFQTVQGQSLPYYLPLGAIGLPVALNDPYVNRTQSHDLRVIESAVDPEYRAKGDVFELQASFDLTDSLTLTSETGWATDFIFSTQDYNRFNTAPGAWNASGFVGAGLIARGILAINDEGNAEFCDPQIGCSDRLVATDLSTATSRHFSQEFRLGSDYDGPFNFSLGANYLRYDTEDKYYVFINSLSLIAAMFSDGLAGFNNLPWEPGVTDHHECLNKGPIYPDVNRVQNVFAVCQYIDPNPIDNLNDLGHNYFLSRNPYKLISYAVFGEAYYNITDNLKVTGGLRWTVDKKDAPRIPSWILAGNTIGYPVAEVVEQEWREPTGRLTVDWKPDLAFTDETLLYGSYAHGYKAGGANPPAMGAVVYSISFENQERLIANSVTKPKTFDAEFVEAFEVGAKNTLLDGKLTLNLAAFYYDYTGYQISYITDRSAVNLNFDAKVWGAEIEADWRPLENLKLGFKGGYENTRVNDGEKAVDVMNRLGSNGGIDKNGDQWVVVKPFPTFSNNCILPAYLFIATTGPGLPAAPGHALVDENGNYITSPSGVSGGNLGPCERAYLEGHDPVTERDYIPNPTPADADTPNAIRTRPGYKGFNPFDESLGHNFGEGFYTDLSGNELPNAPHFTATITADYTVPLPADWLMTLHTDLYYQSEAWTRIFNTEGYDKLKAYTNVNLAAIFTNEEAGWKVMAYVKNVFDRDSITGAFLNSDDSGLTTNVFLTEPRLYGLRVTKNWTGGPLLGTFGSRRDGPYPFTVELGGMVERFDAPNEDLIPPFDFRPEVNPFTDQQNDVDWGDGREVKFTYNPGGGWKAALGLRYGRANGGGLSIKHADEPSVHCYGDGPWRPIGTPCPASRIEQVPDSSMSTTIDKEEHTIVDFTVGRDVGMGGLSASTVSAGLRYAQFKSSTTFDGYGFSGWDIHEGPSAGFKYDPDYSYLHRYAGLLDADREFKGVGPVLSWEASQRLMDAGDGGGFDLDWAVTGGALFGKQETTVTGETDAAYYFEELRGIFSSETRTLIGEHEITTIDSARNKSVTVPVLGLSLGLSYKIDRFAIGTGYRWERYYDAIDGGLDEAKKVDRTFDGPYLKVSVGFGG